MRIAAEIWECVNAAERWICGAHAVTSPARAEGLALAGQRAANLLSPEDKGGRVPTSDTPWVYHLISDQPCAETELVASCGQEAVDQCLAGHAQAAQTGRTVVCRLTPALAGELAIVTLPSPEQIESMEAPTAQAAAGDAQADDAVPVRLAWLPDDDFGRRQVLRWVARIGSTGDLHLAAAGDGLVAARGGLPAEPPELADLLLLCGRVDDLPDGWDRSVREQGIVLQVTSGDVSQGGWEKIDPEILERLRDRRLALWHFDASQAGDDWTDALVHAGGECIMRLGLPVPETNAIQRPRRVTIDELIQLPAQPSATGLAMPAAGAEPGDDLVSDIRHFHHSGAGGPFDVEPLPSHPLHPAALAAWAKPSNRDWPFPLVLPAAKPLLALLADALDEVDMPHAEREILRGELWRICRHALANADESALRVGIGEAAQAALSEFETGGEGQALLASAVKKMVEALPAEGRLVGQDQAGLFELYADRVYRHRQPALKRLCEEARTILVALEARLEADRLHGGEGTAPAHLQASIGAVGTSLVDLNALSKSLPPHRGSQSLQPEDRARMEGIVSELKRFCEQAEGSPDMRQTDRFEVAVGLFDGLAAGYLPVFRAIRAGRLEEEGNYQPSLHAEPLARLEVATLNEDELKALPRVVVVVTEATLKQSTLEEFSQVLQSGRPIHVLVQRGLTDGNATTDQFYPGLSYVSIAHREAYVFQGLMADPTELVEGLDGMMSVQRPSVAFIAAPGQSPSAEWHWMRAETARHGRAAPQFRYDPENGLHWAERFDLSHNPQPDESWPTVNIPYVDEQGAAQTMAERFTFAHAAALEPACRRHFRLIPRDAWTDDQWPVADYLDAMVRTPPDAVPYLWVASADGALKRAVVTRELALRCRDRMRFWTLLQELAGINNEHVRAAVQKVEADAEQRIDGLRAELAQAHAQALEEAREAESAATVDRLVAALMQTDGALPPLPVTPPPAPIPEPDPEPAPEPDPEPAVEEEISMDEPYIDTLLCTTCDECTQLNPRMFVYNEDKQAVLADLDAGTFAELVIAAEKCPANCILPGLPRNGDSTATPEMLERARAL